MNIRIGEAAEVLGVCVDTLRRYEKDGIISSVRYRNQRRFDSEDVELLRRTGTAPRYAALESNKRTADRQFRDNGKLARQQAAAARKQQQEGA